MLRYAAACAMLATPTLAYAQNTPVPIAVGESVQVEIVASGRVTAPADRFRMNAKLSATGSTEAKAKATLDADRAKLVSALAQLGVREGALDQDPDPNVSFAGMMGVIATLAETRSLQGAVDEDGNPRMTASANLLFYAPSRTAARAATDVIEAHGATPEGAIVASLTDRPAAVRRAKSAAIADAHQQALAYGAPLGFRQARILRISEKQDVMEGYSAMMGQMIGMFALKADDGSNNVTIRETLTVEFALTK